MDESVVKHFEQQQVGKMSAAIRQCGYGNRMTYRDCVVGRAYTHLTGKILPDEAVAHETPDHHRVAGRLMSNLSLASKTLGVPFEHLRHCEHMCFVGHTPAEVSDWLESQGY